MRTSTLGERGDLTTTPGTRAWAVAVKREIVAALHDHHAAHEHLTLMLSGMRKHEGYKTLSDENGLPFTNYEAFCVARQPFGLGMPAVDIDRIIAERKSAERLAEKAEPLAKPGEIGNGRGRGVNNTSTRSSTDPTYLTARIARDRPDILTRMKAGEFKSVRAAALEAGIVKPRLSIPSDIDGAARAIRRHFADELPSLLQLLKGK